MSGRKSVLQYGLFDAIAGRRSRRVARGTSVNSGPMSHQSTNDPVPLTPIQEAMLIACTGMTGISHMDGPLDIADGTKELGTPFLNLIARAGASPDNSQPTHFFMTNDDGIYLIRRPEMQEALELMRDLPPRWNDWQDADWLGFAEAVKVKVHDGRLDFPREYPFYFGWNRQLSNMPGTTMFLPVTDTTRMIINGTLNILSEPTGMRPLFLDDWRCFHPNSVTDWGAFAAEHLGMIPKVPYQPIGGLDRVKNKYLQADYPMPLGIARTFLSDHEAYFLQQNLMLAAQAMGLGAWVHVCPQSPYLFKRDESKGWRGIEFRFDGPKKQVGQWPPLPASQPNPVGIDGLLEGLCPPYVKSMDDAVDAIIDQKYGANGNYSNLQMFGKQFAKAGLAGQFTKEAARYEPDAIAYAKEICNYIYDTYGRYPAHVDAWYSPGTWIQVCQIEMEYYQKYFDEGSYARQAQYDEIWGGDSEPSE